MGSSRSYGLSASGIQRALLLLSSSLLPALNVRGHLKPAVAIWRMEGDSLKEMQPRLSLRITATLGRRWGR